MAFIAAQIVAALALLYVGGELLVRGASALALHFRVSPLAVGLTIVAFGTSAPELVVSMDAAISGANDIAAGNVVGSNIANIALILGIAALIRPVIVDEKVARFDGPLMVLVSLALLGALISGRSVSRLEGAALVLALVGYVVLTLWRARKATDALQSEYTEATGIPVGTLPTNVLMVVGGVFVLVGGGHLLVTTAVRLAESIGLSQAAIGLTIVAVGTSLPELATSIVASVKREGDIAVGNVVGSNIFNILGILGVTSVVQPIQMGDLTWMDLDIMLGLAVFLPIVLLVGNRIGRIIGALLLTSYVLYSVYLLAT